MSQEPKPQESKSPKSSPTPSKATSASDQGSSRSKQQVLLRMLGQLGGIVLALVPVLLDLLRQLGQLLVSILKWVSQQWTAVLPKIRTILPASFRQLPDSALTATAIVLLLLLLLIPRALISDRSSAVTQAPAATEIVDQPSEPAVKPPNPNAKRIATIQNQLAEVTAPYAADLVQAVQADFARGRLLLSVTDSWAMLESSRREQLANELLKRAKKLKFEQLEITDADGSVLARSPVVGSNMVLLVATKAA